MRLLNGYVAIKPFKDSDKIGNIFIWHTKEDNDYINISGMVMAVPDSLPYLGREAEELRSQYPDGYTRPKDAQEELSRLNTVSLNFDTEIEVKEGDVVFFDWKQRAFIDGANTDGELLIMRYDALIMKVEKDKYTMLNGYLLVEPCKEEIDSKFAIKELEKTSEMLAIVKHEGSVVKHYREVPYIVDMDMSLKGKKVLVRKQRMKKLEKFYMGLLDNPDYHLIQRKDILAYE